MMKLIETIVEGLEHYLVGKRIIEIACGDSEFTIKASKYAKEIMATDISLERFQRKNFELIPKNIKFLEMNATNLMVDNGSFDITVCYNALGHLKNILGLALGEMVRVTTEEGYLMFIATWKMDKKTIAEVKDIISKYSELTIEADIENSKYRALIVKKNTIC